MPTKRAHRPPNGSDSRVSDRRCTKVSKTVQFCNPNQKPRDEIADCSINYLDPHLPSSSMRSNDQSLRVENCLAIPMEEWIFAFLLRSTNRFAISLINKTHTNKHTYIDRCFHILLLSLIPLWLLLLLQPPLHTSATCWDSSSLIVSLFIVFLSKQAISMYVFIQLKSISVLCVHSPSISFCLRRMIFM